MYAAKDGATGALTSVGIAVGDETAADRAVLAGIPLHLRDTSRAARDERARRMEADEAETGLRRRWQYNCVCGEGRIYDRVCGIYDKLFSCRSRRGMI